MQLVVGAAVVEGLAVEGLAGGGRVLAARRSYPPETAGRWEFPGGKVEAGESPEAALVREVGEELGCRIRVRRWLDPQVTIRPGLLLRVAIADLVDGEPAPRAGEHDGLRWLTVDELDDVDWLDADRPFTGPLRAALAGQN
jgi:8-oxo-dGTP diphosphatase